MYLDYRQGLSLVEIADKHGLNPKTVSRAKKAGNWESRKEQDALETKRKHAVASKKELSLDIFNNTLHLAYDMLSEIRDAAKVEGYGKVPIKTMADVVDKLLRLQVYLNNDGVEKKQVETREHKIDWNNMIKATLDAKKQDPEFDDREFVRKAVSKAFGNEDE